MKLDVVEEDEMGMEGSGCNRSHGRSTETFGCPWFTALSFAPWGVNRREVSAVWLCLNRVWDGADVDVKAAKLTLLGRFCAFGKRGCGVVQQRAELGVGSGMEGDDHRALGRRGCSVALLVPRITPDRLSVVIAHLGSIPSFVDVYGHCPL